MSKNPLLLVQDLGQSIWLDFIRRHMLIGGELKQLIREDGLRGVTSNPAIFEKAISGSNDYVSVVRSLAVEGKEGNQIYEALAIEDVQQAADDFRSIFEATDGRHGFVSLEVSPLLARDTSGSINEALRLWHELDRPNVYIKVPGTKEGLPAIQELIGKGVNINVTLLFGLDRYRAVTDAYLAGLEQRAAAGMNVDGISSVASFFLSRIDLLVDPILEEKIKLGGKQGQLAELLHGEVAIASAKIAYQIYKEVFSSERFEKLAARGARTQQVLWASTSTKNPSYSDVKYVEALIGPDTINTLPMETLNAYRDHGDPALRLEEDVDKARKVLGLLPEIGINLGEVTQQLEDDGIDKFVKPFDRLIKALEVKRKEALAEPVNSQESHIGSHGQEIRSCISKLESCDFGKRLWRKDASLWNNDVKLQQAIQKSLGWLHVAEKMVRHVPQLEEFTWKIKDEGFSHAVHMGMGGSSLAPLVLQQCLGTDKGLQLRVLDSTDPATILKIEREIPIAGTLFIVASKSGTTVEPLAFQDYFYDKVRRVKGNRAGENFLAITDRGSLLSDLAQKLNFRRTFFNFEDIGGRYSALSCFGLLPAALAGVDIGELLERALRMEHACAPAIRIQENPGLALGTVIGELAASGMDKLTFIMPDTIAGLGLWLEQLLAESTGKDGKGVIPITGEPLGNPSNYGNDRIFIHFELNQNDVFLKEKVLALRSSGRPVMTIRVKDLLDIGQEFFRWEIATATAASILGINPFDQPNVQESKDNTNRLLKYFEQEGKLPGNEPTLVDGPLHFFFDKVSSKSKDLLSGFFATVRPGDNFALQAFLTETPEVDTLLQNLRVLIRDRFHLATTVGYGPRFLHSTGQYHKGGPNRGIFLQLTADDAEDAEIPGRGYTFGLLKKAQALGDLEALRKHDRRVMRIDLGKDTLEGLGVLIQAVRCAI